MLYIHHEGQAINYHGYRETSRLHVLFSTIFIFISPSRYAEHAGPKPSLCELAGRSVVWKGGRESSWVGRLSKPRLGHPRHAICSSLSCARAMTRFRGHTVALAFARGAPCMKRSDFAICRVLMYYVPYLIVPRIYTGLSFIHIETEAGLLSEAASDRLLLMLDFPDHLPSPSCSPHRLHHPSSL